MTQPHHPDPGAREPMRDEFLAQWRHALRNPLNALLAAAHVLEAAPAGSVEAVQARDVIRRQARQLAWLVSDIPSHIPPHSPRGDAGAPDA